MGNLINILLIEDNEADTELIREALSGSTIIDALHVVSDTNSAEDFLHQRKEFQHAARPDIVILDLGLPTKSGLEVLRDIKSSPRLCTIPVLVLTNSEAESDVTDAYLSYANCFINKPMDMLKFIETLNTITHYWGEVSVLPPKTDQ